jgi:hypothetical protein
VIVDGRLVGWWKASISLEVQHSCLPVRKALYASSANVKGKERSGCTDANSHGADAHPAYMTLIKCTEYVVSRPLVDCRAACLMARC